VNQDRPTKALLWMVILLAAVLSACSSAPTRYYSLEPSPNASQARLPYRGPPLQISSVHVPPGLDRDEVLREVAPGQFEVREFDHWTAPLGQMARQTLSEDLVARLPAGSLIYPDAPRPLNGANLSVDILAFRMQGDSAVMQVSWNTRLPPPSSTITTSPTPGSVTMPHPAPAPGCGAQLRLTASTSGSDASGTSMAFSALLGQLADQIAEGLSSGCMSSAT